MQVRLLETLPEGLLDMDSTQLVTVLEGPSMIRIAGKRASPVLVSVLLHGDETSGWDGVRMLLQKNPVPARSLILLIGNIAAASQGVRTLPHQPDYNRIWHHDAGEESMLCRSVLNALEGVNLYATVDLHNNTGWNPHYSILSRLHPDSLSLAALFSSRVVHVIQPDTTLANAFHHRCPTVTLELGPIGDPHGAQLARNYLETLLSLPTLPAADRNILTLYQPLGRVEIDPDLPFSFDNEKTQTPLILTGSEAMNFQELERGYPFAICTQDDTIRVISPTDQDVTTEYLQRTHNRILIRQPLVQAMYTRNKDAIRQDCLCYFMEPI